MAEFAFLQSPVCRVESVIQRDDTYHVNDDTTTTEGCCPICAVPSSSIHSYRQRYVKDMPIGERPVMLEIRTKRFRCRNPDCPKITFVEEVSGVLAKHARRTDRLSNALWHIGQVAGGQAGARLTRQLHLAVSRTTLLRILRQHPMPQPLAPSVIGIDDWAKRRGQRYGTIVVDLERRRVVDLLDDRDAETVASWLRAQPQIQVVARDRSTQYAQGVTEGAPQAVQVADRWHLLKNLSEMVERVLHEVPPRLRQQMSPSGCDNAPRNKFPRAMTDQKRQAASRSQRMRVYRLVQYLRRKGHGERRIARVLGMSRGKVRSLYATKQFPERKVHNIPSRLDPYLPYLEQRAGEGCVNAQQLWRELRERGYPGSSSQVSKWLSTHRNAIQKKPTTSPAVPRLPSWRTCQRLITSAPDQLTPADQFLLEQIRQKSLLAIHYQLTQRFITIVRQRQATLLDEWLDECEAISVAGLQHFAASLRQDYAAVRASLEFPWSNGQTEGQIHRLKMLKRHMYGRAKLDLLRLRVLYSP